ncbi:MAG: ArnT family glycosyltransferase [Chloroflexota bacterium]|jgi:4-amino-4-deoxy-L-arabinose transferase-like glycosyltransferase
MSDDRMLDQRDEPVDENAVRQPAPGSVDAALERLGEGKILWGLLIVGLISHSVNMFGYPLYLGDEGIYMEQAWAVLRLGKLAPYTYFYDHAPAGWLFIALWSTILPQGFLTFGMAVNSGRVLMLIIHLISLALLFRVTTIFSRSLLAATATTLMFTLSPLSVYYHRMVMLDNIMVLWLLLSLYLLLNHGSRLVTVLGSGAAFGLTILTKENAVFFLPVMAYLLFQTVQVAHLRRFATTGWAFALVLVVSVYPLFAFLKSELLPAEFSFLLDSAPAEHVSLIGTIGWQLQRSGGGILDPYSQFWRFFWTKWWAKDSIIIVAGMGAATLNLLLGYMLRRKELLVASLLCFSFGVYLARGSVMLEFYAIPIIPFLAMNFGMLVALLMGRIRALLALPVLTIAALLMIGVFVYTARDHYLINLTRLQIQQLEWIRANIPNSSVLVVDDDLWVDLHEPGGGAPIFPRAHSHWKVAQDPAVQVQALNNDWRQVDYMVMSDDLLNTFNEENETFPLEIYANSRMVAAFADGDVQLQIRKVVK